MFILRTVGGPDKPQTNVLLGKFYTISFYDSLGYKERLKELYANADPEKVYAIVESELHHPIGVFTEDSNYIMTSDGKTFANISNKV